jgi:histidyl-tRNA synthetase
VLALGSERIGAQKVCYVARCFRDETTTDSERLREFTQIGVEFLGPNALDRRKVVRADALRLMQDLLPEGSWSLQDGVPRGLNLYDSSGQTFEISSTSTRKQLLGGGPYLGGAGWALGLERLMLAMSG